MSGGDDWFCFDIRMSKPLTNGMKAIAQLSSVQLRRAANIKEKIAALQKQLDALLGNDSIKPVKKKRRMSASARARIAAAQRARWAKVRAGKK